MDTNNIRMVQLDHSPGDSEISEWIGKKAWEYWSQLSDFIEKQYPSVFAPDWYFGGKKHGWALRYKKSKSFCTFIPEKGNFKLQIVFGAKEREKVESVKNRLSEATRTAYEEAKTYHDGKWLYLLVNNEKVVADIKELLVIKRRPKNLG